MESGESINRYCDFSHGAAEENLPGGRARLKVEAYNDTDNDIIFWVFMAGLINP
jgi:hypothetical protein